MTNASRLTTQVSSRPHPHPSAQPARFGSRDGAVWEHSLVTLFGLELNITAFQLETSCQAPSHAINRALREAQPRILHALGTESVPAQPLLGRVANVREPQHTCTSTYMNYTYKATPMLLCPESNRLLPKSQNPSFTVPFFPHPPIRLFCQLPTQGLR